MEGEIINRVAESGLITLDLEEYYPRQAVKIFDLAPFLFMKMILKEKDFRTGLQQVNWDEYKEVYAGVTCTADAIIPAWAYMLAASYIQPVAKMVVFGNEQDVINAVYQQKIDALNGEDYANQRVIIKGCGDVKVPEAAYLAITAKLRPHVKSIMYGEACSNVPVYKRR